jgi:hypothetical protein
MFSKAIFLSLIALFVVVIVWSLVRPSHGRKPPPQPTGEIVEESKRTPTRALRPADLKITLSETALIGLDTSSKQHKDLRAKHRLVIQNKGRFAYRNIMLDLAYQDRTGKTAKTTTRLLEETVAAGQTVSIPEFVAECVPARTASCIVAIRYADMESKK